MTLASGLNLLAGIWLIIAPFVLNYDSADPVWNDVVFGAAIATVGLVRLGGLYRESWLSWSNAVFGAWIFVSAFWLDNSATAAWNDLILGAIVIVLAVWSASASETPVVTREDPRRSGRRPPPGEAGDRPTW
ncbi:MAG: SPW repeat protein [Nitrososphaerota archaeon]